MKVLFVTYGGGHVAMCLPVMRALRSLQPSWQLGMLALTTAYEAARRAGERPLGYRDFATGQDAARVLRFGEQLLAGHDHEQVAREESIAYLGFNFLEWADEIGERRALERWHERGRQGFKPVKFMARVLREWGAQMLVTTNSPRSEQAAIEAAASLGIPSLAMVDLFALPGDPFAARSSHADRITVLADATRSNLIAAGVEPKRIFVTGNPAFDELGGPHARAAGDAWRAARGWDGKHVVLWAGHLEPNDAQPSAWAGPGLGHAVQERLVHWVSASEENCLAIRYHPNEMQAFTPPGPHPRIHWSQPSQEPLLPVLMGADQVVVQATTVGAQAHVAGKAVVSLGFSPLVQRTGMDYQRLGMGRRADDLDAMVNLIEERRTLPAQSAGSGAPSGAAEAIADHVAELALQQENA
jgi:hypothetical protein